MRETTYLTIASDQELRDLGLAPDAIYASNAVDTPQYKTFCVLHWNAVSPGVGPSNAQELTLWMYDDGSDYDYHINPMLLRARELLLGMAPASTTVGWITEVTWQGDSDDLYDDGYSRIVRNASFRFIGSGI